MSISPPITPHLGAIVNTLRQAGRLVLLAPPGTGKTTALPPLLLSAVSGQIYVTQPRRLAARLAASFVATQRGQKPGQEIGYQVRFDQAVGPTTRLIYATEGLLLQRLVNQPQLPGVSVVIIDEFHERHLETDLLLALINRLRLTSRPDLLLVVMSATVAAESVAVYLQAAPIYRVDAVTHQVAIDYVAKADERPLERQVVQAIAETQGRAPAGDTLVFLPGVAEINRSLALCHERFGQSHMVLPLHGSLSPAEQQRAVTPAQVAKIILSTNVAETSVTIDGVTTVIDSGLVRRARHDAWSGLSSLRLEKASQAEAIQRAGRAGRTRPGYCLRLYSEHDFKVRPKFAPPNIAAADLSEAWLLLAKLGIADLATLPWFEAPPQAAVAAARSLLLDLQAIDASGALTPIGQQLADLRLHPRLGRVLLEAVRLGAGQRAARLVAVLAEMEQLGRSNNANAQNWDAPSDALAWLEDFENQQSRWPKELARNVVLTAEQLSRQLSLKTELNGDAVLLRALLAGFVDRVARRQGKPGNLVLADGGSLTQDPTSVVKAAEWMVVTGASQQQSGISHKTIARAVSAIEVDWLLDVSATRLRESNELVWDEHLAKVFWLERLMYGQLVLSETRGPVPASQQQAAAARLAAEATRLGWAKLDPTGQLQRLEQRLTYWQRVCPDEAIPALAVTIAQLCQTQALTTLDELRMRLTQPFEHWLPPDLTKQLNAKVPGSIRLPSGRDLTIHYAYAPGQDPWIASYLQDFFGMSITPVVAGQPVVVHLWAPNKRAVQVTRDLAGFWRNHYPSIRKELMRKYPRHTWPENPLTAPPQRTKQRSG